MRLVVQRVSSARVDIAGETVASIGAGLLVLAGVGAGDDEAAAKRLAAKLASLRIFGDDDGKMNLSLKETGGQVLLVSQFTLYAETARGNRPSFTRAAAPEDARKLISSLAMALKAEGVVVQEGRFGAMMQVGSTNDGPVTILMEA